jgi:hypothetical protein
LSITHHTRKRPSTGPRTTHGPQTSDTPWTSEEDARRRRRVGAITVIIDLSGDGGATDDGVGRAGAGAGAEGPTPTTVGMAVDRKRKATSKVWLDFDEMFTIRNDKKVRYGAKCNTMVLNTLASLLVVLVI